MLLRETGFTFAGLHSYFDMGLDYAEKNSGHPLTPRIRRNGYQIAGTSGTILLPGETRDTLNFEGTLYPAAEPRSQAEAQAQLRRVAEWLTQGRRSLIFDYEPQRYYLAEVNRETEWTLKNWFGGELSVRFEAQPYAYNVFTHTASKETGDTTAELTLRVETGWPAPLMLQVTNRGTSDIKRIQVTRAGDSGPGIAFGGDGFAVHAEEALQVSMEAPASAEIQTASGFVNALPCATAFGPLNMQPGDNSLTVRLTYGVGIGKAAITVSARGRY